TISPCQPSWTTEFAANHALADWTPFIQASDGLSQADLADFNQALWKNAQLGGRQYSLPYDRSIYMLYYNEQLLQSAGIAQPPRTWQDFAGDASRLVTQSSWASDVYNSPQQESIWESIVMEYGGKILDGAQTRTAFNSSAGFSATTLWADMVKRGYVHVGS